MSRKTTPRYLNELVTGLMQEAPSRPISSRLFEQIKSTAATGWFFRASVEDFLLAMDPRLGFMGPVNFDALTGLFELNWRNVAYRPKANSSGVMFFDSLSAADFAELLMHLEELGFRVDPGPLVEYLLPGLKSKNLLSSAELSVFWFARVRHRGEPNSICVDTTPLPVRSAMKEWKTSTGYRLVAMFGDDGKPVQLTAHAPRYRQRPEPVETTCPECGFVYFRGDAESSASHRKEHKRRMRYLDPKPDPRLVEGDAAIPATVLVTTNSPAWQHNEMYERALAFKREFGYDFVQWGSPKGDSDPEVNGIFFLNEVGAIVGACAFRVREHGTRRVWALQWIWFAPRYRRQGHLARQWQRLRADYGDFEVEHPVSPAMQAFLEKQNDAHLMDG